MQHHWAIIPGGILQGVCIELSVQGGFHRICGTIGLLAKRDFTRYVVPLGYQSRGTFRGILTIHVCAQDQ